MLAGYDIDIVQALKDNDHAIEDYKYAKEAAKILEAEYFGEDGQWDLTKPSFKNITFEDCDKSIEWSNGGIAKMLKYNPTKTHIGFIFVSGHGLIQSGYTCLLLNEIKDGYYKLAEVEYHITEMARYYTNAYLVGIFATERLTFNKEKHSGMISYEDAQAKRKEWQEIRDNEQKS